MSLAYPGVFVEMPEVDRQDMKPVVSELSLQNSSENCVSSGGEKKLLIRHGYGWMFV